MSFNPITDVLAAGGITFKGAWDANANTPALVSGVGDAGDYYIVGEAGTTNLDGIASWDVNDWAVFNGTVWQKVSSEDQAQLSFPEPIIFRPGAPSLDEPGVYGTWLGVMAFVATLNSPVEVVFDDSVAPCVIPTGTHTFPVGSRFRGIFGPANIDVDLDSGAELVGVTTFEKGLTLISNSASPIITVSGGTTARILFQPGVKVRADGAGPFISITGAGSSAGVVLHGAELVSGASAVIQVVSSATAIVECLLKPVVGMNTLEVDGSSALTMNLAPNTVLNPTQAGIAGLFTKILTHQADQAKFDPTVLSSQLTAENIQDAIDELTRKHVNKQIQTVTAAGTTNIAVNSARLILVDVNAVGASNVDIYLPAISADSGPWKIKRLDSNTAATVRIFGTGGNTIDLLPAQQLGGWPASMHLVAGPSAWYLI